MPQDTIYPFSAALYVPVLFLTLEAFIPHPLPWCLSPCYSPSPTLQRHVEMQSFWGSSTIKIQCYFNNKTKWSAPVVQSGTSIPVQHHFKYSRSQQHSQAPSYCFTKARSWGQLMEEDIVLLKHCYGEPKTKMLRQSRSRP